MIHAELAQDILVLEPIHDQSCLTRINRSYAGKVFANSCLPLPPPPQKKSRCLLQYHPGILDTFQRLSKIITLPSPKTQVPAYKWANSLTCSSLWPPYNGMPFLMRPGTYFPGFWQTVQNVNIQEGFFYTGNRALLLQNRSERHLVKS